jgi:hypothetical protein
MTEDLLSSSPTSAGWSSFVQARFAIRNGSRNLAPVIVGFNFPRLAPRPRLARGSVREGAEAALRLRRSEPAERASPLDLSRSS